MDVWLECTIGALAAIGLVCILKGIYDIILTDYLRTDIRCELSLYGCGTDPTAEQLLNTAEQIRRKYLPGMIIVFYEDGNADSDSYNFARAIAARRNVEYIE